MNSTNDDTAHEYYFLLCAYLNGYNELLANTNRYLRWYQRKLYFHYSTTASNIHVKIDEVTLTRTQATMHEMILFPEFQFQGIVYIFRFSGHSVNIAENSIEKQEKLL